MENKRLHIEATEEAITVYWEKMAGEQGLRYRIYLNGTQAAETEKTHGTLEGLKGQKRTGGTQRRTDLGKQLYGTYPEKKTPD